MSEENYLYGLENRIAAAKKNELVNGVVLPIDLAEAIVIDLQHAGRIQHAAVNLLLDPNREITEERVTIGRKWFLALIKAVENS